MESLKLINPQFDFQFADKTFKVRKATLENIIEFQTKFAELSKAGDAAIQSKMAAYCLYLILKDADSSMTEEFINKNCPDVDMADVVEMFAFMNRQKVEILRKLQGNSPVQTATQDQAGTSSSTS